MMEYLELLQRLNACHGPSGDEREVGETIRRLAEPYADTCTFDTMGNLIVRKKGRGPRVMFAAHMDTIGLIVTHIDEKGYLSFGKLGGVHPEDLLHTPVRFQNGVQGVVSLRGGIPWKDMTLNDLFLDIGAASEEAAKALVQVGDTAVYDLPIRSGAGKLFGPHLDNRISCVAMLEALSRIKTNTSDLYFVFTVQEELGLRGSKPAAFSINPQYGIAVDVTPGNELEAKPKGSAVLGGGAAIKVMDSSAICHPNVVKILESTALKSKIPCQKDVMINGGTDAGAIQISQAGVWTGGISIPCRYLHSPVEMVDEADVTAVANLITSISEIDLEIQS